MDNEEISMVQECSVEYKAIGQPDGGIKIVIDIPKRFKNLWLVKLSELRTTEEEIREYEED